MAGLQIADKTLAEVRAYPVCTFRVWRPSGFWDGTDEQGRRVGGQLYDGRCITNTNGGGGAALTIEHCTACLEEQRHRRAAPPAPEETQ